MPKHYRVVFTDFYKKLMKFPGICLIFDEENIILDFRVNCIAHLYTKMKGNSFLENELNKEDSTKMRTRMNYIFSVFRQCVRLAIVGDDSIFLFSL